MSLVKALAVAVPTAHGGGDEGERAVTFTGLLVVRLAASGGDEQRDFARSVGRVRRTEGGVSVEGGGLDLTCAQITQTRTLTEHRADGSARAYKLVPKTDAPGYASFKASLARFETRADLLFELVNVAQAGRALALAGERDEVTTADLVGMTRALAGLVGVLNDQDRLGMAAVGRDQLKRDLFAVGVVLDVASALDTAARGEMGVEATVGVVGTVAGLARATVLGRVADSVGATVRVSRKVREGDALGALADALWTAGGLALSTSGAGGTTAFTVMTGAGALPAAAVFGALALAAAGALMVYQAHEEAQEVEESDPLVEDGWLARSFLFGRGVYVEPARPRTPSSGSGRYYGGLGGLGDVAQQVWDAASDEVRREARLNGAFLDHAFSLVRPDWSPGAAAPAGYAKALQDQLVGFMEHGFDFRPAVDVVCSHPDAVIGAPGGQREERVHTVTRVDLVAGLVYMPAYGQLRYDVALVSRRPGGAEDRRSGVVSYVRTSTGYRYRVVEANGRPKTEAEWGWVERPSIALALTPSGAYPAPELAERQDLEVPRVGTGTHYETLAAGSGSSSTWPMPRSGRARRRHPGRRLHRSRPRRGAERRPPLPGVGGHPRSPPRPPVRPPR